MQLYERVKRAAGSLPAIPDVDACLLLGTGLGDSLVKLEQHGLQVLQRVAYTEIEEFPHSAVTSHKGELAICAFDGLTLGVFQGRFHLYEGWSALDTAFPSYLARELGARQMIISNAAGALNGELTPGSLMLITDHLNMTGQNPLLGWQDERMGPQFTDMSNCYNRSLRALAENAARDAGVELATGIYAAVLGPSLETSAERRWLRACGADAVGMSTAMEVIAANQCGLSVVGFSAITNNATGGPEQQADSIEEVLEYAEQAAGQLADILPGLLQRIQALPTAGTQ